MYQANFVLKPYRISANLTQAELAELIGVSSSTISKYECNQIKPNFNVWIKLANALDTHPFKFFDIIEIE